MKAKQSLMTALALIVITVAISCTRTVDNPSGSNNSSNNNSGNNSGTTTGSITSGTWVISSFTERGENKTSDYAGVNFTFATNGTVNVSGAATANGTYSISATNLNLNFPSGKPLDRLNEPWKIVESNNSTVRLDHPENDEDEHVTFSKK